MKTITVVFLLALATTYLMTPWVRRLAIRAVRLHTPDAPRAHTDLGPCWGGLEIYMRRGGAGQVGGRGGGCI